MPVFRSKKLITERHADPVTMDHIIELRKENERLREALRKIRDGARDVEKSFDDLQQKEGK